MKRKWIAALLAGCMLAALLLTGCSAAETVKRLRFGVAGEGGVYHNFGEQFAALENETSNGTIELRTTAGSAANLRLLTGEYLQLAIAQADLAQDAYNQTGIFAEEEDIRGFGAVAALYTEACQVIVRADSDIQSIEDLQGKTVSIGTVLSKLLSLTGMTFPIYIGAMIAAACIRNLGEYGGKFTVYMGEINDIGGICLSLFLGMAMITLKIWQLAELALPLVVLLAGQTLFMILYSFVIVYNVMGRDYDAAVIVSGTCGFGMGATPNAMANMQAVCDKYSPSVKAYLLIPLVGSLFADFINSLVITVFINFI